MESDDDQIYRSPCVFYPEKFLLLYGSGSIMYIFNLKDFKMLKKLEFSQINQFVRSISVDGNNDLVVVSFDDKTLNVYDKFFNLVLNKSFNKKISFVSSVEGDLIVGDFFGDIFLLPLNIRSENGNFKADFDDDTDSDTKILVPFSHYSTITSSSIDYHNNLLFTGNKDGKIVANSLLDLHKVKGMPVTCLDFMNFGNVLISLSIDNTIRFWNVKSNREFYRIILKGSKFLQYYFRCNYPNNLIVVLCLKELLFIHFDFERMSTPNYFKFKFPFVSQTCCFVDDKLYLVDHYSNLYQIEYYKLLEHFNKLATLNEKEKLFNSTSGSIKVKFIEINLEINEDVNDLLSIKELYKNNNVYNTGKKIKIKKHTNLN